MTVPRGGKRPYTVTPQHLPPFTIVDSGFNRVARLAGDRLARDRIVREVVTIRAPEGAPRYFRREYASMYPVTPITAEKLMMKGAS